MLQADNATLKNDPITQKASRIIRRHAQENVNVFILWLNGREHVDLEIKDCIIIENRIYQVHEPRLTGNGAYEGPKITDARANPKNEILIEEKIANFERLKERAISFGDSIFLPSNDA